MAISSTFLKFYIQVVEKLLFCILSWNIVLYLKFGHERYSISHDVNWHRYFGVSIHRSPPISTATKELDTQMKDAAPTGQSMHAVSTERWGWSIACSWIWSSVCSGCYASLPRYNSWGWRELTHPRSCYFSRASHNGWSH